MYFSNSYIQHVLGLKIPLHESTRNSRSFQLRVLKEHEAFEAAMRLDENFFKGLKGSWTKVKKFNKVLKSVMKDPKKIVVLIKNLTAQLKDIAKKIFNFADGSVGILGLIRSILTPAKSKLNSVFSKSLKTFENVLKWLKVQANKGIKAFDGLAGWKKALSGIALIVGLKELYGTVKSYYQKPIETISEAIAVWTDDSSVLKAFEISGMLGDLEEGEEKQYEDPDYDPETQVLIRMTDGKPLVLDKEFWKSAEFKKIVDACKNALGVFVGKKLEKFAISALLHAATGGWATLAKVAVKSWKASKSLGGVLGKALDGFLQDEEQAQKASEQSDQEMVEESLRRLIRMHILNSNSQLRSLR